MKRLGALTVLLALLTGTARLSAGGPVVYGAPGGIGISFGGPRFSGGVYYGGFGPSYPSYGYSSFGFGPWGYSSRISSVTILGPAPQPRPLVVVPFPVNVQPAVPPIEELRDEDFPGKIIIRPGGKRNNGQAERPPEPAELPPAPLPGVEAGKFRPLRPEEREQVRPADPAPPPPAKPPAGAKDAPPVPQDLPPADAPVPMGPLPPWAPDLPVPRPNNPGAPAAEKLLALGKIAFGNQEYARAERRFRQAVDENPKEALPYFYLGQALFALGKYREATAALHAGLRLRPTWPTSKFRSRELYGLNGEDFVAHLQTLQEALHLHPDEATLMFLAGYQLWFDNRADEARPLFRQAEALVAEPRFIRLFLHLDPAAPVAANR
ncbi:MAG: tetratricopeptide repeat protein [Planctomycetia bacterium]|nr:tetratricopeptide repeat protein [Planctomycetia bacterium]